MYFICCETVCARVMIQLSVLVIFSTCDDNCGYESQEIQIAAKPKTDRTENR